MPAQRHKRQVLEQMQKIKMVADEEWTSDLWRDQQRVRDVHEVLAGVRIFEALTADELKRIAPILHKRSFLPHETIVRQGAPGGGMYIILSGSADARIETADGETIHFATLREQQFFGELSLLNGTVRIATVIAREHTQTLCFFRPDLMDLIDHSPQLGFKIVWQITQTMVAHLAETLKEYRNAMKTLRDRERDATA